MFGERSNQEIAELVLDEVLEIEHEGRFVCGAGAYDLIYGEQPAQPARAGLPQLTLDALKYAQSLDLDDTGPISARLYFYNRVPLSPRWVRQFPRTDAVAAYLGIDTGGANFRRLDTRWSKVELEPPMDAWFQWRLKHARAPGQKTGQTFKLYISPQPEFVRRAFDAVLETLSESGTAPQFKVGNDAAGLLRPDKMVAYFWSLDALRTAADRIAGDAEGLPGPGRTLYGGDHGGRAALVGHRPATRKGDTGMDGAGELAAVGHQPPGGGFGGGEEGARRRRGTVAVRAGAAAARGHRHRHLDALRLFRTRG